MLVEAAIYNCTIADNELTLVPSYGGGLYCTYGSTVDVINSIIWGNQQILGDAIQAASDAGILFVAAAGNYVGNTDITPNYPSCYDVPNVMSIAATDHNDELASLSGLSGLMRPLHAPDRRAYRPPGRGARRWGRRSGSRVSDV